MTELDSRLKKLKEKEIIKPAMIKLCGLKKLREKEKKSQP